MFYNFHTHSVYSKKDALPEPIDIAKKYKSMGCDAFCITDHGDMGAWIKAYQAAEKEDMQFIPGVEFYIKPKDKYWKFNEKNSAIDVDSNAVRYHHIICIAKNQTGVKNLIKIYNAAETHYGKQIISKDVLFKNHEGIICTNACVSGEVLYLLRNKHTKEAEDVLVEFKQVFGDDFYIELQYHNLDFMDEVGCYNTLVGFAKTHNIKMIPTTDSHYLNKEDAQAHSIYKDIFYEGYKYDYSNHTFRPGFSGDGYFVKDEEEMREAIRHITSLSQDDIDTCIANTQELRNKCEITHFPKAIPLSDKTQELRELVERGFKKKREGTELEQQSRERLEYELSVIEDMGFTEYFINVYTILNRAKMLGILTGTARGSAAGSEVCYLTEITHVDPIKYNLLFERFLNPSRWNYPDIDMDIQVSTKRPGWSGKDILIESLSRDVFPFTGQIVNEMRASTLTLFKRLAKVFDLSFAQVNKLTTDDEVSNVYILEDEYTGWLPQELGKLGIPYNDKWKELEKYLWFCYQWGGNGKGDNAEGLLWNTSIHASGCIFYPVNDKNVLPKSDQGIIYRGHSLESMGYIKYDLLGLKNLDPIAHFIPIIEKDTGKPFDWEDTYDKDTWKVFQRADTDFVFQFSSPGMKRALSIVKPASINKLAELNSLYRPGCIKAGIFDRYLNDDWTDEEKVVGEFLKEEFGQDHSYAMIFQEDIMKVVEKMAGFSLADADLVRRAMARKEKDTMDSYRKQFVDGFNKEKYGDIAETVWDTIESFATYTFNKSHAVAYSIIAYWTAYIFCHYRNEYLEYLMNEGTKDEKEEAITYLSNEMNIVFPSLETKNTSYEIKNDRLLLPTVEVQETTNPVDYLLNLDAKKKQMIKKYGILDKYCPDRKGLVDVFDNLPKKRVKDLTDVELDVLRETDSFADLIKTLSALGFIDYKPTIDGFHIVVHKAKSDKEFDIVTDDVNKTPMFNCQEDARAYGLIRPRYVDKAPAIDLDFVTSAFFRNLTDDVKTLGTENKLLNKIVGMSPDYQNVSGKWYRCVINKTLTSGYPKVELIFNNGLYTYTIADSAIATAKSFDKYTPVEALVEISVYYNKSTSEIRSSTKVHSIRKRD